ncbi:MAG: rhodanese-like domain-containing protein [Bacteroidota bacterium]
MKLIFYASFLLIFHLGTAQIKSKPITELSQNDIKTGILVDVRTPREFVEGHLPNAINYNWYDENFTTNFDTINKQHAIYLYCKVGGRSSKAANRLYSLGFKNVTDLTGGYIAYVKNADR